VHRLGQEREVEILRYIAKGTIEERMLLLQVCTPVIKFAPDLAFYKLLQKLITLCHVQAATWRSV